VNGELEIELVGEIAGILAMGKKNAPGLMARGRLTLVAGAGFEPAAFRL
jgi:hypothetical protein